MSVILITRGSYSYGKEIAERTAHFLGYECVDREVLLEASAQFNIPEIRLQRAISDAPSVLDRYLFGKTKYIAYIRSALLQHLVKDNVLYHGYAGHVFVGDIPHALKVLILANLEDRIHFVMERDGISRERAASSINRVDRERRKWGKRLYGIDIWDPGHYDLVLRVDRVSLDHAVETIVNTVRFQEFQSTPESQKAMENLMMAAKMVAALVEMKPDIQVSVQNGVAEVTTRAPELSEPALRESITKTLKNMTSVKDIRVRIFPSGPPRDSLRA